GKLEGFLLTGGAVLVLQAGVLLTVADDLLRRGGGDDVDVLQAAQGVHKDVVSAAGVCELQDGAVVDHAGEVDGSLDAGVTATDDGDVLALEQRVGKECRSRWATDHCRKK